MYESLHGLAQLLLGYWCISHGFVMFSLWSKDVSPPLGRTAVLFPSFPFSLFFHTWMTLTNLYLERCKLAYTEKFHKKWLSETYCFICWKDVEDNTGYISFLFTRAHKRNFFLVSVPGIIMCLLSSGFIFMLWTQWIMELIVSSLPFLERVKSTNYRSPLANVKHFKSTSSSLSSFLGKEKASSILRGQLLRDHPRLVLLVLLFFIPSPPLACWVSIAVGQNQMSK